ncbi:uncharacterized protein LOC142317737 [Lycorma delicatula]|uniref:uncharacterized protein LOC142317737 n=1 Tax=Lycorma delicatula TaxID=130591 RepID=UPI003F50E8E0
MYLYIVNFWRLQFILFLTLFIKMHISESVEYSTLSTELSTEKPTLCRNYTTSCSHQIPLSDASQDSCMLVRYDRESEDCTSSYFKGDLDPVEEFGKVVLSAFIHYNGIYAYVGFNVTFTDIKWTKARFRFYESGSNSTDICREFQVTPEIPSNTSLFYDCLWNKEIQYKTYHFQYTANPRSGQRAVAHQSVFFVPNVLTLGVKCDPCPPYRKELDIEKLKLFVSVDVSVLPVLRLHLQTAHEIFNITRYRIQLVRTWVDHKWLVLNKVVTVLPNQSHIYIVHNTDYRPGIYNFSVIPLHDLCHDGTCSASRAPGILIVASTETPLLIAMVGTVILIPVLIAVYFMWRRTCMSIYPPGTEPWQPPKVLLVYNPDYKNHVSDMIRFNHYLKAKCRVDPMFDLNCIPISNSKDQKIWYKIAFQRTEYILVFASPPGPPDPSDPHPLNVYRHLGKTALFELRFLLLENRSVFHKFFIRFVGNKQIFGVCLPGCTWENFCSEAPDLNLHRLLKLFTLPSDFDKLLKCLGVNPMEDGGKGLTDALSMDISRFLLPLSENAPTLDFPVGARSKCENKYPSDKRSLITEMKLMGSEVVQAEEPEVEHRPNSLHPLINITDLNIYIKTDRVDFHQVTAASISYLFLISDPTKWYREAFRQADFILVFASPAGPKSAEPHKCNPYLHLDRIALNQLRLMLAVPGPSCRVVSVLLPGCSWETLPTEATRLRQFTLPRDLDPLLVCLGAAPQCDGGEGLREALANDIRPDPQPLPRPEPLLNVSKKCIANHQVELQHRPSEISRMNLMGTQNKDLEPEVQHRPRRDDTLLDIGDLNLSGGC